MQVDNDYEHNVDGEDVIPHEWAENADPDPGAHSRDLRTGRENKRSRSFQLHEEHIQSGKRLQRLRSDPSTHYVPVPIGPAFPRRDRDSQRAKYCRLMLILFKPWRVASDLRDAGETWTAAFDRFTGVHTGGTGCILDNMQVMHECKDAKDVEDNRRR
ncbi:hypothetical protein BJ322DRAFT_1010704, partial [Thelephora terrestris]